MRDVRLGDDIDDFCVRCKRVMNHAVVSVINAEPAKVRCRTCHSDHDYRREQPPPPKVDPRKAALFNEVLKKVDPTAVPVDGAAIDPVLDVDDPADGVDGVDAADGAPPFDADPPEEGMAEAAVADEAPRRSKGTAEIAQFWYWFFAGPALLLAALSLRGERKRADYTGERLAEDSTYLPPVTVIVPVKGHDDGLRENIAALASLDYPDYELIIAAREAADIPAGVLPRHAKIVLAHGQEPSSEKVQNLQAAVRAARKRSEVFAFADSDGRVTKRWLRALTAPLAEPGVGASTGVSMVCARAADVLDARPQRVGCGVVRPARAGRQSLRVGRRHGDPQRDVLRGAHSRVLGQDHQRRLRAFARRPRCGPDDRVCSGRTHAEP